MVAQGQIVFLVQINLLAVPIQSLQSLALILFCKHSICFATFLKRTLLVSHFSIHYTKMSVNSDVFLSFHGFINCIFRKYVIITNRINIQVGEKGAISSLY